MRTTCFLFSIICLFTTASVGQEATYKWVDENGTITFRDTPPPKGTEATIVNPEPLATIEYGYGGVPKNEEQKSHPVSRRKTNQSFPEVNLYVTSWCGYCAKAKSFFNSKGVPFKVYDVERNSRAAKRHRKLNPSGSVPVAVIGGRTIRGFSPEAYAQALGL